MKIKIFSCFLVLILLCTYGCGFLKMPDKKSEEKKKEQQRLAQKYYVGKRLSCYAGKMWGSDFDCTFEITGISIEGDRMYLKSIGDDPTDLKHLHCKELEGEYSISQWDESMSYCSEKRKL